MLKIFTKRENQTIYCICHVQTTPARILDEQKVWNRGSTYFSAISDKQK